MILSFSLLALSSVVTAINFDWNCQNSLAPCNNACFRVNCRGTPLPFNYDSDMSHRGPRRTRSGCNRTPCSNTNYGRFGNSCDEFPFASVTQGGTGATLRCVDGSENSSEGGQLGRFYDRLNNGDQFGIVIRNHAGAAYCDNAQHCNNDGGEFRLSNGGFVNAKTRRDNEPYFTPEVGTGGKSPFRKFMGHDGIERLWLSNDRNGTIVGQEVWSEEFGTVKISHEIK